MAETGEKFYTDAADAAQRTNEHAEPQPLPGANYRHYPDDGGVLRQMDLVAAEQHNINRHAEELGVSRETYDALKRSLGRTPLRRDIPRPQ